MITPALKEALNSQDVTVLDTLHIAAAFVGQLLKQCATSKSGAGHAESAISHQKILEAEFWILKAAEAVRVATDPTIVVASGMEQFNIDRTRN